jgi:arabinogalactan endo-1,4-beta-galactosidase
MAAVLVRWMNLAGEAPASFRDTADHWSGRNIALVQEAGYMLGMPDGSFRPDQLLTRAEAVTLLNRVLNRGPLNGIQTSPWADVTVNHWAFKNIVEAGISHSYRTGGEGAEEVE